ncbi:hypothetical protein K458DRAFT_416659 [Lentithecium fluviatile CBS 122367]|uniref:Aflatoxin regulatory protein domain-containing protein n=1 Tax=Lentithecium fluviatile CBS 122367 TaxID=1168545 RepID=A0A6G1J725_9PLEO|nr:hypothetical protein K458DRAFT_416659 [Lentithecium fluviatile CBS 122367]
MAMANSELDQLLNEPVTPWSAPRSQQRLDSGFLDSSGESLVPGLASLIGELDSTDFGDIHGSPLDIESPPDMAFPQLVCPKSPRSSSHQHRQPRPSTDPAGPTPSYSSSINRLSMEDSIPGAPGVSSWATLLEDLSRTSSSSPVALDELLRSSSRLLPRVTQTLRSLHPDASCMATLILILLCLTQATALFEQCIPSTVRRSGDLSVHLGTFELDRDVQHALQRHIVGKELSRILQASALIKQALQQPGLASVPKRTHSLLINDLQTRVRALAYLVREKWNTA